MLTVLILACLVISVLCLRWFLLLRKSSGNILRGCLPIVGHSLRIIGDTKRLWKFLEDISTETLSGDGVSRIFLGMQTYYVITDPDDIMTVGNNCIKKHFAFDFSKQWLGDGLITAPPLIWKRHRKILNPAFTLRILHGYLDIFNAQSRELVANLADTVDKGPVDISDHFRRNAMRILSQTALGISGRDGPGLFENYMSAADQILELIVTRFQNIWLQSDLIYNLIGLKKKETDLIKTANDLSDAVIEEKRITMGGSKRKGSTSVSSTGQKYKAFLDLLLDSSDDTLTDKEKREEVHTIIVAGTDTSSWLVAYVCVALATYPEVQKKVIEELVQVFGNSDRDVNRDDLLSLVYTEAVIKETLRLYPVAPVSLRTVETGLQLKNHYLHPGDHIIMSFYGVNRHPIWGDDAVQFRPERWMESDDLPIAFGGFGIGKRSCIGKTFAMISMKILLAHLFRRYAMDSGDITKLELKLDFIAKPVSGHHVSLTERHTVEK